MIYLLLGLGLGLIIALSFELITYNIPYLRQQIWDNPKLIFGYHFHHSAIGLMLIILGLLSLRKNPKKALFLIGFGLGIIIIHTISDGRLIFISR